MNNFDYSIMLFLLAIFTVGIFTIKTNHLIETNHAEIMDTLNDPMYDHCRARGQVGGELNAG